jgi:hypothetical protein
MVLPERRLNMNTSVHAARRKEREKEGKRSYQKITTIPVHQTKHYFYVKNRELL